MVCRSYSSPRTPPGRHWMNLGSLKEPRQRVPWLWKCERGSWSWVLFESYQIHCQQRYPWLYDGGHTCFCQAWPWACLRPVRRPRRPALVPNLTIGLKSAFHYYDIVVICEKRIWFAPAAIFGRFGCPIDDHRPASKYTYQNTLFGFRSQPLSWEE